MTDKIIKETKSVLCLRIPIRILERKENYEIQTIGLDLDKRLINALPKSISIEVF